MRIAVDVDGVLADRVPALLDLIHERHGVRLDVADVTGWEVTEPYTGKGIRDFFAETDEDPDHLLGLRPVAGAVDGMSTLAADHELLIATYRKSAAREPTLRWLDGHDIPYDEYVREVGEGKRKVPADLLIDDSASTVRTFTADGRRAVLFRQPWNAGVDMARGGDGSPTHAMGSGRWSNVVAATDWDGVVRHVAALDA